MDLKSFASDFMEGVNNLVEFENANFEEELTTLILEYVIDSGEISTPEICAFKKTKAALHAYDYNVEGNSLDLFILVPTEKALAKVNGSKVSQGFNRLCEIYRESMDGTLLNNMSVSDEMREVVELIQSTKGQIDTLRLFVLTNGLIDSSYVPSTVELDNGLIMEQNIWDMQRIYQQDRYRSGRESIEIDFPTLYNTELQCLKMKGGNDEVEGYLAIIPGITLAQIYKQYKQALLERNVRTFLQFRTKVNRGIRDTILHSPDMFFSFNNGISTTASDIEIREEDGAMYITRLIDWQIVNGGQTTASLAATYSTKGTDMSKVFVPMKVSVIRDKVKANEYVPQISANANSQTAIKDSDFSANEPYLVDLEKFSRETWVPNGNAKGVLKWYFERTRGQYLDEQSHLSGKNETTFKATFPKQHLVTKTDIAKYQMAWDQLPYTVCLGAERNYKDFVKLTKAATPVVTETYYKRLIAKGILFKTIDRMVKEEKLGGYKANMNAYILASISLISKKQLDLDSIWQYQKVNDEITGVISKLIPIVWEHLTQVLQNPSTGTSVSQGMNVNEWSKKKECWDTLKRQLVDFDDISDNSKLAPEDMIEDGITVAQQNLIEEMWNIPSDTWFAVAKWAKEQDQLTPVQRKMAFSFGKSRSWNKMFTLKQALAGQKILKMASENGFIQ